jgi:3',5'-cyclic AMP phosphodiesterase CpdA
MIRLRFIHLSDVHVREPHPGWRLGDIASKRLTGWVNLTGLRRGQHFQHAALRVEQLMHEIDLLHPDAVIFSGDASTLGFPAEFHRVANLLRVGEPLPGVAVPGNHDHYTRSAARTNAFEDAFAPWLVGRRLGNETYPFAREIGGVWFIGVNSSVPNRMMWDSRGAVGHDQLRRLDQLLISLPPGPRVLVTHYPYCTAEGVAEPPWHGLRDRTQLAEIVQRHRIRLWLSGHRHRPYTIGPTDEMPFVVACAGSATQEKLASFAEMTIDDNHLSTRRFTHRDKLDRYEASDDAARFNILFGK